MIGLKWLLKGCKTITHALYRLWSLSRINQFNENMNHSIKSEQYNSLIICYLVFDKNEFETTLELVNDVGIDILGKLIL